MQPIYKPTEKKFALILLLILVSVFMLQCNHTVEEKQSTVTLQVTPSLVKTISQQSKTKSDSNNAVTDFAPQGWYLLKTTEGDLNSDNRTDVAVVFSKSNPTSKSDENNEDLSAPRLLVIALRDGKDKLQRAVTSQQVVLCHSCGVMIDEPLTGFSIEHGAVVIKQNVLGKCDVSYSHKISYQQGQWQVLNGKVEERERTTGMEKTLWQEKSEPLSSFDITKIDVCSNRIQK